MDRAVDELPGLIAVLALDVAAAENFVRSLAVLRARHPEIVVEIFTGNHVVDLTRRDPLRGSPCAWDASEQSRTASSRWRRVIARR